MSIVVTKDNFEKLLPHILEDIRRSSFVAMDTEFTGLRTAPEYSTLPVDSHDARYSRMRKSVSQTGLLQIGLVPFMYNPETDSFVHRSYSFYLTELQKFAVMDPANNGKILERIHVASSCHFLRDNKFDFNEFYDGAIPYMSRRSEEALRMNLLQESFDNVANFVGISEQVAPSDNPSIFFENERAALFPFSGEHQFSFSEDESNIMYVRSVKDTQWFRQMQHGMNNWVALSKKWIEDPASVPVKVIPISSIAEHNSVEHYESPDAELILLDFKDQESGKSVLVPHFRMPYLSRWRRKVTMTLMEQSLQGSKLVDDIYYMSQADAPAGSFDSGFKSVHVFWLQNVPGGRGYLNDIYFRNEMERIAKATDKAIGFRKVVDAITDHKIPLVGHHCLYDLLHLVDKFVGELPEDVSDFARLVTEMFPGGFYDTKYLSSYGAIAGAPDAVMDSAFSRFVSLEDLYKLMDSSSTVKYRTPTCLASVKDALLLGDSDQQNTQNGNGGEPAAEVVPGNGRIKRGKRGGVMRRMIDVHLDWTDYLSSTLLPPPDMDKDIEDSVPGSDTETSGNNTDEPEVVVNEGASHDAGYDAAMTGVVFLKLASRLVSVANSFNPNRISLTVDDARRLPYELSRVVMESHESDSTNKIRLPSWFLWEPISEDILEAAIITEGSGPDGNSNGNGGNDGDQLTYERSFPVLSSADTQRALETALQFFREESDKKNRFDLPDDEAKAYGAAMPLIQIMNRVAVSPFTDFIGPTFLLGCLDVQSAAQVSKEKRGKNAEIRKGHLAEDILNPLLFSRTMQQRKNWVYITNIYPALSNRDVLKIIGDALDIRLTNMSYISRQMQTNALVILPSEHHVHLLVSEWMYARFGRNLDEKEEDACDDLLPEDKPPSAEKSDSENTGLFSKWFKKVDDALATFSYLLTGRDNGDNMLGLGGWRKRPISESFDSKEDTKRRVADDEDVVVYPSGRKIFVPPGLPDETYEIEVMRARTGMMDPLSVSLDDALSLSAHKQNLGSLVVMPYQEWLDANKDMFHGTCDHESK